MAGSYNHVTDRKGNLLSNEDFVKYIENLGDAYESVEEMYYMIQYLSKGNSDLIKEAVEWFYKTKPQKQCSD